MRLLFRGAGCKGICSSCQRPHRCVRPVPAYRHHFRAPVEIQKDREKGRRVDKGILLVISRP